LQPLIGGIGVGSMGIGRQSAAEHGLSAEVSGQGRAQGVGTGLGVGLADGAGGGDWTGVSLLLSEVVL